MNFHVLTLFPEMIEQGINTSITGRAIEKGLISLNAINIRDYAGNKHGQVDDYPYGGGAGMVMQPGPVYRSYESVTEKIGYKPRVIYLTPQGKVFNQSMAEEFSEEEDLVFLCGHYEGIDERVYSLADKVISIGDYVLTSGELASMVVIDAVVRRIDGVLGDEGSSVDESFYDGLLEYPQYTRPAEYRGMKVPDVLLSGHHARITEWRREQSLIRTKRWRPDLLESANISASERNFLDSLGD